MSATISHVGDDNRRALDCLHVCWHDYLGCISLRLLTRLRVPSHISSARASALFYCSCLHLSVLSVTRRCMITRMCDGGSSHIIFFPTCAGTLAMETEQRILGETSVQLRRSKVLVRLPETEVKYRELQKRTRLPFPGV